MSDDSEAKDVFVELLETAALDLARAMEAYPEGPERNELDSKLALVKARMVARIADTRPMSPPSEADVAAVKNAVAALAIAIKQAQTADQIMKAATALLTVYNTATSAA